MRGRLFVIFVACFCTVLATGQLSDQTTFVTPISNEIEFDFGNGNVTDVKEDWNGFIWIATTKGLFRFDGTEVRAYSDSDQGLPHSLVYDMLVDHEEKRIWLATRGGLAKFDPATELSEIFRHDPFDNSSLADDLARRVIKDRQGRIWVSCANRGLDLLREDGQGFQHFFYDYGEAEKLRRADSQFNLSSLNSFTAVTQDALENDVLWLGGPFGLLKFNIADSSFQWIDSPLHSIDAQTPDKSIVALYSQDQRLIVGHTAGAYIYHTETKEIEIINNETEHGPLLRAGKFIEYNDMIAIAFRNGLLQMDKETMQVSKKWIDQPDLDRIYGIQLFDSAGRSWISSSGRFHLHHGFQNILIAYLLPTSFRMNPAVVKVVDDEVICLTSQGEFYFIFDLALQTWRPQRFRGEKLDPNINWQDFIQRDDRHLLLLSRDAIYQLDYKTGMVSTLNHDLDLVRPRFTKLILEEGQLWIGSLDLGLFQLDLATGKTKNFTSAFNTKSNFSAYTWISDLHQDRNKNLWIRLGRGYSVHDPKSNLFTNYPPNDFPNSFRYVRNFAEEENGNIWLSSEDRGIGKVEFDQIEKGITQLINTKEGLSSNNILQIDFDEKGILWILHDLGFDTYNPATGDITKSTWSIGIPKCSRFFFLPDGSIGLILDAGGIGVFDPGLLSEDRAIPEPYLTKLRIRDRLVYQGNRLGLQNLRILTSRDQLGFEFSALGFLNPKEFAYRLDGVDEQWIETTERQTATYSNLKPGNYQFLLKARNAGDRWSEVKNISVYLAPQWYESWWFKGLVAIGLFVLFYLFYRWRLNTVRQKERMKSDFKQRLNEVEMQALRSQMNPHFLFNSLNSIQHFIIKNQPKEAVDYLNRFSRLVRLILQHSRAKLVTLKEELDALKLYLDLENLRFKNRFSYKVAVDPTINQHDIEIPPMLIQPFVENAIWHGLLHKAGSGEITISISKQGEALLCTIEDNGVGRKASSARKSNFNQERKSMGMSITKNRLDIINLQQVGEAAVEIHDLESSDGTPEGTRVEITLPV